MGNRIYIQTKTLKSGEQRIRVFDDQSDSQWVVLDGAPKNASSETLLAAGYELNWEIQDIFDLGFLSTTPAYFNDENFDIKAFEVQLQAIKRAVELDEELPAPPVAAESSTPTPKIRM